MMNKILAVTLLVAVSAGAYVAALGAATGAPAIVAAVVAPPATPAGASPSLPPHRVSDCVTLALLDDMCTKRWYSCKRGGGELRGCIDDWQSCCTLRGQGARTRLGSAQPVTSR